MWFCLSRASPSGRASSLPCVSVRTTRNKSRPLLNFDFGVVVALAWAAESARLCRLSEMNSFNKCHVEVTQSSGSQLLAGELKELRGGRLTLEPPHLSRSLPSSREWPLPSDAARTMGLTKRPAEWLADSLTDEDD